MCLNHENDDKFNLKNMKHKDHTSRPDLQKNNTGFKKNLTQLPRMIQWSYIEIYTQEFENRHIFSAHVKVCKNSSHCRFVEQVSTNLK